MDAELKAELLEPGDQLRIAISLTNTGGVPFVVDRNLVLGLRVFAPDLGLPASRWEHVHRLARPARSVAASRFVELAPGEFIRRELDLRHGFATFWHASATYVDGTEGPLVHEYLVRLPEGSHPSSLVIDYSLESADVGALREYTGLDIATLGPFPGRVTAVVAL